jgi:hypothetical protein
MPEPTVTGLADMPLYPLGIEVLTEIVFELNTIPCDDATFNAASNPVAGV